MTCPRCADLEEQLAYLKSELGLSADDTVVAKLRLALNIPPGAALILAALYAANGRLVRKWALRESYFPYTQDSSRIIDVYICRLRRRLGKPAIGTLWGDGLILSAEALSRIAEILAPETAVRG